jgi:hypothetical protein
MRSPEWGRASAARLGAGLVALSIAVAACGGAARQAARDRLPLVPQRDRVLGENLLDAEQVVAGQLVALDEALEYERLGGLVLGLFGSQAVVPLAYNARIRVDSTLLGPVRKDLWITFFAPRGAPIPGPGQTAIWVLHRRVLWRLARCSEQQGFTSTACPYDIGLALDSDDDVRPLDDWPRIRDLLRTLRPGPS